MKYDVLIIGGGVLGSSVAYHLARDGRGGRIAVVEPDPTYEFASTPRSSGGVRRQFCRPENIALCSHGIAFYRDFAKTMAVDGEQAEISFTPGGYLLLSDGGDAKQLETNFRVQTANGVPAQLLERAALSQRYPSVNFSDVAVGVLTPEDAWIDPHGALMGFRRKARSLGVEYLKERVVAWEGDGKAARRVVFESGGTGEAAVFVLTAGAWSGGIGALIGWQLPIRPFSRQKHYFRCHAEIEPLPFIKTESRLAFRPEGVGYAGGVVDWNGPFGINFDWAPEWFETEVWPRLAHRVPAMQELRLERTWACHYERCTLDNNGIIGRWEGGMENAYVASGFSGHGLMQAPGAGLALAELILDGSYSTMDLTRFGYRRVLDNDPYPELGIW